MENDQFAPTNFDELIDLARKVYDANSSNQPCQTADMNRIECALQSLDLSQDEQKRVQDLIDSATQTAELSSDPPPVQTTHFSIQTKGLITTGQADAAGKILDKAFDLYTNYFGKYPNGLKKTSDRYIVQVNGAGVNTAKKGATMLLGAKTLKQSLSRSNTIPHEEFHMLQFAFGMPSSAAGWLLEGLAAWGGAYLSDQFNKDNKTIIAANHDMLDFQQYNTVSIFKTSYDAFPFWVYLQGFKSKNLSFKSDMWVIEKALGTKRNFLQSILSIASDSISMQTEIAALVSNYTLAKIANEWRKTGYGYNRPDEMGPFIDLFDTDGNPWNRGLSIHSGFTKTLATGSPSHTFPTETLPTGCVHVYEIFAPNLLSGKTFEATITQGGTPVSIALQIAIGVKHKPFPDLPQRSDVSIFTDASKAASLTASADRSVAYVIVTDGQVYTRHTTNVSYELKVEVK